MPQERAFRWWSNREQVAWSTGIAIAPVVLMSLGYEVHWTGFGRSLVDGQPEPAKTLWDWLDLLIAPIMLAIGGYLFNWSQNRATRGATKERAQHEALQAYLDKMSELLVNGKLHEMDNPYDPIRITARARTLAVLRQLDGKGKKKVLLFLREARLINRFDIYDPKQESNVLYHAHYVGLKDADLSGADLTGANLSSADLKGAKGITNKELAQQARSLEGATMPNGQKYEAWLNNKDSSREGGGNTGPSNASGRPSPY